MASDIEIVNISNFEKIQNFLNDSAYKEILENSENFNTRLCIERRLRMPFLDPQTGVAQTHCALFMKQKQRMPGFRDGQIYTYPSARWRKPKRQYLLHHQSYKAYQFRESQTHNHHHYHSTTQQQQQQSQQQSSSQQQQSQQQIQSSSDNTVIQPDGNSLGATADNDSKDSHPNPEKEWFYEDMELSHVEEFEEDFDSDADFDDSYSNRKRKRAKPAKKPPANPDATPKRGRKGGRRKVNTDGEPKKRSNAIAASASFNTNSCASPLNSLDDQPLSMLTSADKLPSEEAESSPKKGSTGTGAGAVGASKMRTERDTTAHPSPYCDFCLGDARENKKTNLPEELVSCSDCGRSGHPTCLQFTPNMIISVKRYRWQCIECKYCSICGTSDNDDQLLFCDDCDRGYHMYCLSPPLITPPEGSWSCKLCLDEFHSGEK
ncbi:zinc finger protein ubi-d4 B isoform X2 [Episyrphus balteatus]|uniref:zinc finger protein ubi-d4 B isoform X2 n=1 Tax=Episyrphus balteatus TaxID=286459 RepID=UPI0024867E8A|nr:zinc finger protein ubi-d4 B isoform X2 [Episyrphus balteatus]